MLQRRLVEEEFSPKLPEDAEFLQEQSPAVGQEKKATAGKLQDACFSFGGWVKSTNFLNLGGRGLKTMKPFETSKR